MNKKKLLKKILSAFTISTFVMGIASPLYTTTQASSTNYSSLAMMLLGASNNITGAMSIKLSKYVSYSYMPPENAKVFIMCKAGNAESRVPEEGGEGTYICNAFAPESSPIIFTNPSQTRNVTFKAAGKSQNVTISFPYQIASVNEKDGEKIEQNMGNNGTVAPSIDVNIKIKVPPKQTNTITDEGSSASDSMLVTQNNGSTGLTPDGTNTIYNPDGTVTITTCSDGSLFCPEDSNSSTGTTTDDDDGLKTKPDDVSSTLNTNPFGTDTSSSNDNYKNLLDDLLDYTSSNTDPYNSSDADWANSSDGTNGDGNLDDWFGGVEEENNLPVDMTTDNTGVDSLVPSDFGTYEDDTYAPSGEYNDVVLDYNGNDSSNDSSSYLPMEDLDSKFQQGLDSLSGLNGNNSGLLGAIDSESVDGSLGDKLKDLLGNNSINNARKGTASDQELYDIAKKWLLANGFTMNDIRNGKNYDANSAYTEPTVAWDMNRITTLLKGRKISLTSPTDVKKDNKSKSTLSQSTKNAKK